MRYVLTGLTLLNAAHSGGTGSAGLDLAMLEGLSLANLVNALRRAAEQCEVELISGWQYFEIFLSGAMAARLGGRPQGLSF